MSELDIALWGSIIKEAIKHPNELFDCKQQEILAKLPELLRLARLGAAMEADSRKTGGMHTNSGKVYFNTAKTRARLVLRVLDNADISYLSDGERTMFGVFMCEYRQACNHGN